MHRCQTKMSHMVVQPHAQQQQQQCRAVAQHAPGPSASWPRCAGC
jgi:hypothetical protein